MKQDIQSIASKRALRHRGLAVAALGLLFASTLATSAHNAAGASGVGLPQSAELAELKTAPDATSQAEPVRLTQAGDMPVKESTTYAGKLGLLAGLGLIMLAGFNTRRRGTRDYDSSNRFLPHSDPLMSPKASPKASPKTSIVQSLDDYKKESAA